jgi:hypothetical protein
MGRPRLPRACPADSAADPTDPSQPAPARAATGGKTPLQRGPQDDTDDETQHEAEQDRRMSEREEHVG